MFSIRCITSISKKALHFLCQIQRKHGSFSKTERIQILVFCENLKLLWIFEPKVKQIHIKYKLKLKKHKKFTTSVYYSIEYIPW